MLSKKAALRIFFLMLSFSFSFYKKIIDYLRLSVQANMSTKVGNNIFNFISPLILDYISDKRVVSFTVYSVV